MKFKKRKIYKVNECDKKFPETEWNYNDVTLTNSDIVTTGKVHLDTIFNGLIRGTDSTSRIGDTIRLKRLEVRGIVSQQNASGNDLENGNVDLFRLTIVVDKQTNGTAVVYNDVFKVASIIAQWNHENRNRFEILYDKVHKVRGYGNIQATTITPKWDRDYKYFEVILDLNDIPVHFDDNTGLVSGLTS